MGQTQLIRRDGIKGNKAPRRKQRGINRAFQAAGFRQPSPQGAENLLGEIKFADLGRVWMIGWVGNLALAFELVMRGILCNWLVCLALWMASRTTSDAAKLGMIFWCLFAFIASGYEHSIANMTIFSIALLAEHPDTISLAGMWHNLLWVTLGNTISGTLFMAAAYWFASSPSASTRAAGVRGEVLLVDSKN